MTDASTVDGDIHEVGDVSFPWEAIFEWAGHKFGLCEKEGSRSIRFADWLYTPCYCCLAVRAGLVGFLAGFPTWFLLGSLFGWLILG